MLFQTCTSLSDRAGYFFAQRSHCGKKEEIGQRKPKSIREEKNLEISFATLRSLIQGEALITAGRVDKISFV